MSPEQFCYWLQGVLEIRSLVDITTPGMNEKEVSVIKEHLSTVFIKVTPDHSEPKDLGESLSESFKNFNKTLSPDDAKKLLEEGRKSQLDFEKRARKMIQPGGYIDSRNTTRIC